MTDIEKGSRPGWPDAEWVGKDCPECGAPFVARDKHGLYCCVCLWQLIKNQQPIPPEFSETVDKHFWNLIN